MTNSSAEKTSALVSLSRELGREDRALAMLGEGNTSCRLDAETFLVKASGSALGNLEGKQLVTCRFSVLLPLLDGPEPSDAEVEQALLASRVDPAQLKPSVEAMFHAWLLTLPGVEVVGHTHPVGVNGILCAGEKMARKFAEERHFPDAIVCCGTRSVLAPYVDPGTRLARAIRDRVQEFIEAEGQPPRIILLQNHGLIACGGSTGAVLAATLMAEKTARIFAGAMALGGTEPLSPENVARIASRSDEHYRQRMLKL
jgi:rhamnose utilization protein RhaD (predicted bifunctional aldolase and dehydrogenase)